MQLKLKNFDGPLDLLLYLIKLNEVNIFDIPIVEITRQFMSSISEVHELEYSISGEYLAMATQLVQIKAQMLVPLLLGKKQKPELEGEDPRAELVDMLLEYKKIKEASQVFEKKSHYYFETQFSKEYERNKDYYNSIESPIDGLPVDLLLSFQSLLLRDRVSEEMVSVKIYTQKITVQEAMNKVREVKNLKNGTAVFSEFYEFCQSRYELIAILLALLEMTKSRSLDLYQKDLHGEIVITSQEKIHELSI